MGDLEHQSTSKKLSYDAICCLAITTLLDYVETTWLASSLWSSLTSRSTNSKSEPTTTLRVGTGVSTASFNVPRPVLHDCGPAVPRGADRDTAAPPAVGREGAAPSQHVLRRCQPATDGAVVAVRRRPAACRRHSSYPLQSVCNCTTNG